MAKFTKTFPVTVEFSYNPEERATMYEEGCPEEFDLLSFKIDGKEVLQHTTIGMDWVVRDYFMEKMDE